jgi:hypothetical protein
MPPRTPLGSKSTNPCIQKKNKTSKIELSPHKCSVIKGLHKAGCSVKNIMEIENTPRSTVHDTVKLFTTRPKGHSLPRSRCPSTLTRVEKRAIIRFCHENVKATYNKVKQQLQLSCSLRTIACVVRKQGIKKWIVKKWLILTKEMARAYLE